jgi:hypothetical protein
MILRQQTDSTEFLPASLRQVAHVLKPSFLSNTSSRPPACSAQSPNAHTKHANQTFTGMLFAGIPNLPFTLVFFVGSVDLTLVQFVIWLSTDLPRSRPLPSKCEDYVREMRLQTDRIVHPQATILVLTNSHV